MWWAITCDQMTTIIIHDPFRLTSSESQTVSESHRICVYTCASDINKKTEHTAGRRLLRSPGQAGSQAAMKRWFSSSLCEVAHALEETEDEKKSIHNTTLRIQHKHLNLRPSPQVCCDPEMTIFLYCSLISIERIRPTQNWLCVHKLEITIDFFPSSFQKTGTLWHWQICLPCLLRWGYPEAFWEVRNAVICLIAHLMLEQEPKKKGTNAKEWIRRALGPAISRDQPLYGEPFFSPGFWCWSLTTPDGTVQCLGFSYLWREEPVGVLREGELITGPAILSGVRCEESAILTPSTGLSLFNSHLSPHGTWEVCSWSMARK